LGQIESVTGTGSQVRVRANQGKGCIRKFLFQRLNLFRPLEENQFQESQPFECVEQFETKFPGDFVFFYRDNEEEEDESTRLKGEISAAYEKVASTAHLEGNLRYDIPVSFNHFLILDKTKMSKYIKKFLKYFSNCIKSFF
jgi:hypothetical protein